MLAISKNNFQFHYVIGRGGFGKVFLAFALYNYQKLKQNFFIGLESRTKKNKSSLCIKRNVQNKVSNIYNFASIIFFRIITKKSVNSVMNERHLLSILRHP